MFNLWNLFGVDGEKERQFHRFIIGVIGLKEESLDMLYLCFDYAFILKFNVLWFLMYFWYNPLESKFQLIFLAWMRVQAFCFSLLFQLNPLRSLYLLVVPWMSWSEKWIDMWYLLCVFWRWCFCSLDIQRSGCLTCSTSAVALVFHSLVSLSCLSVLSSVEMVSLPNQHNFVSLNNLQWIC